GKDWTAPRYFDSMENDCYKAEAALLSELSSEAYNLFGFEVQYYLKDINTKKDRLYGEDPLANVERRFLLKMYTESIPTMQRQYELQGMIYPEIITCQCTVQHFYEASQLSYPDMKDIYEAEVPKIGDIVYIEYSDTYYEVINVKEFAEQTTFLSTPITYTFKLRVWHNNHEDVDAQNVNNDPMDEFRKYAELAETFKLDTSTSTTDKTSDVAAESDMLSTNTDVKHDTDIHGEPKDNVPTNVKYKSDEVKEDNPQYYDPFEGW
ncbi:MAG: hypothetical protein IJ672_03200, partial [Methanobrevibacter sp.]|nr:hypothetical protein [Methanobrevibacter sp.]